MRRILTTIFLLAAALPAVAQRDFRYMVKTNPFLTGANPANYNRLDEKWTSMAEVSFNKENGGLASLEQSPDCLQAGVLTESYAKISDRIAFYGKLSYSYFNGKNMGGQIMMNPSYNPVQFLESTDTTLGVKSRELFHLVGGMTYTFNPRWSAGIKIDYESGDQSKIKDPRFLNYWMDLGLSAGFTFNPSEIWTLGLALRYRNTQEQVRGGIYGTTEKQYNIYTDKGGFWGVEEMLDGDLNYMPASSLRPMMNNFLGGSLQFVYNGDFEFFNEISFDYRKGYYGKRTTSTPVFFEYSGIIAGYDGAVLLRRDSNLHKIFLNASYATLTNNENSFDYITPPGKNVEVRYKGQTKLADRNDIHAVLGYNLFLDTEHYRPSLEMDVTATFDMQALSAIAYPFYRNATTASYDIAAEVLKSFFCGSEVFTIDAGADFLSGFGNPKEDGTHASGATSKRISFDAYLNRQFEFDTASRVGAVLGFTYTHIFNQRVALYATARDEFRSLLSPARYLKGMNRNAFTISVGCKF